MQVRTFNVRGVRKTPPSVPNAGGSSTNVHQWIKSQRTDILSLTELQLNDDYLQQNTRDLERLERAMGAHSARWSKHCCVLLSNPNLEFISTSIHLDGRVITTTIHCALTNLRWDICTIYGPAPKDQRVDFFRSLILLPFFTSPPLNFILMGDLNIRPHKFVKYMGFNDWITSRTSNCMSAGSDPPLSTFLSTSHGTYATLDYIFASPSLARLISSPQYYFSACSDHDMIGVIFSPLPSSPIGKGTWRLNVRHLNDTNFRSGLDQALDKCAYQLQTCFHGLSKQEQWDRVKKKIKQYCISASIASTANKKELSEQYEADRRRLKGIAESTSSTEAEKKDALEALPRCEEMLDIFTREKLEGMALRAGVRWQEEGERNTHFFFNSLKQKLRKRHIPGLLDPTTGLLSETPEDMIQTATDFYSWLYTPDPSDQQATDQLLCHLTSITPLQQQDNEGLLAPLDEDTLDRMLKHTPKFRSPGKDGLPFELYPILLAHSDIRALFLSVVNDALAHGLFPTTWLETIMILLFKKGDASLLANWRPLSLINSDAKLFTKLLTNRLRPLLPQLIHPGQTGFMKGRFIADNGLVLSTVMDHCRVEGGQQIGVMLDFEKAYDRVNPDYLAAVLSKMGFAPRFIQTIKALFFQTQIHLNINGHIASGFTQGRGLRQGDPLSPLLFNIALEPLLQTLMHDPRLQGISSLTVLKIILMAYADDVLLFLNNKKEWQCVQQVLQLYKAASNGNINFHKTTAFPLTTQHDKELEADLRGASLQWHDNTSAEPLIYLGYPVPICTSHINKYLDNLLQKITSSVKIHSQRYLSVLGKAILVNSLLLSRLWHALWVVSPPVTWFKEVVKVLKKFVLPNKPAPTWQLMCSPKDQGGLGIIDPATQATVFQLRHVQNMLSDSPSFGRRVVLAAMQKHTNAPSPFSAFLDPQCYLSPRSRTIKIHDRRISTVRHVLQAFARLPKVTWDCSQLGASIPPVELLLASPLDWWLQERSPTTGRFSPITNLFGLWTNDFLCIEARELTVVDSPPVTGPRSIGFKRLYREINEGTVRFRPSFFAANRAIGIVHTSLTVNAILRSIELDLPNSKWTLFEQATTRQLRQHLLPVSTDRTSSSRSDWMSFWRAKIHASSRNTWWRYFHHALPCAVVRYERWHVATTPACPDCQAPRDDFLHYMILCPKKRVAWELLLFQYTTHTSWTEENLQKILLPSSPLLNSVIPASYLITPHQLISAGLQGVVTYNNVAYRDNTFLPSETIYKIMANSAKKYRSYNSYIRNTLNE
jgi:hypothetical protein